MGIIVKGDAVAFSTIENADWRSPDLRLPRRYGIIHDPDGLQLPRCVVYFGKYTLASNKRPIIDRSVRKYFGGEYEPRAVKISSPNPDPYAWKPVATVTHIFYVRPGFAKGGYHHPFRGQPLTLEACGAFYKLSLTPGSNSCIVDDRGFVFP